jgi:hypothetical protein
MQCVCDACCCMWRRRRKQRGDDGVCCGLYDSSCSANLKKVGRKELDVILHHLDNKHAGAKDGGDSEITRLQQQLLRQVFLAGKNFTRVA